MKVVLVVAALVASMICESRADYPTYSAHYPTYYKSDKTPYPTPTSGAAPSSTSGEVPYSKPKPPPPKPKPAPSPTYYSYHPSPGYPSPVYHAAPTPTHTWHSWHTSTDDHSSSDSDSTHTTVTGAFALAAGAAALAFAVIHRRRPITSYDIVVSGDNDHHEAVASKTVKGTVVYISSKIRSADKALLGESLCDSSQQSVEMPVQNKTMAYRLNDDVDDVYHSFHPPAEVQVPPGKFRRAPTATSEILAFPSSDAASRSDKSVLLVVD